MRRAKRRIAADEAKGLLEAASAFTLATTTPRGEPVIRVLNGALVGDRLYFHGAIAGEKSDCLGRAAVVSVFNEVALIPSYFQDPRKACPATQFYRSAQAQGVLVDVSETREKAAALEALMQKYQPEGGYVPLSAEEPLYTKDLRGVRVFALEIAAIVGKMNLGQDKPQAASAAILDGLWRRGEESDLSAIRSILEESPEPWPESFRGPLGCELLVSPRGDELNEVAQLLENTYWREESRVEEIIRAHRGSSAWIGARNGEGRIIASVRAVSDGAWFGGIFDFIVASEFRGRGLGKKMMELLLDHPRLRTCERLQLGTRDARRLYEGFGFVEVMTSASGVVWMVRTRSMRQGEAR